MNSIKKLGASLLCILLLLSCTIMFPFASACADSDPAAEASDSVVRVVVNFETIYGTEVTGGWGTGFCVGAKGDDAEIFVTNCHVVTDDTYVIAGIYITVSDVNHLIPASILYTDPVNDIAIIKAEEPVEGKKPIVLMSPKELTKSESVWCLGFPGIAEDLSNSDNMRSYVDDIVVTKGSVSNPNYLNFNSTKCVLTDAAINGGNSGGPMVNEYGFAVGIDTIKILDESGMGWAVSVDYVMEALDRLELPYMVGKAGGKIEGQLSSLAIILICAAAAAVIAAVIVISVIGKKKKVRKQQAELASAPTSRNSSSPSYLQNPEILNAAAAPFAIQEPVKNSSGSGNEMLIRCEAGPLAGRKYSSSGSVIIGRDSSCDILLPNDAKGISRHHCKLTMLYDSIELTDLGSSYGTFLGNGTKLNPNSPVLLRDGDVFYVASKDIPFSVHIRQKKH